MAVFNRLRLHGRLVLGISVSMALVLGIHLVVGADESKPNGANSRPNGAPPLAARTEAPAQAAEDPQSASPIDERHPLYLPLQEAYKARAALKDIKDYECEFTKRELIGPRLMKTTMQLKLRQDPFSVYLKFIDPNKGREAIYVEGKNKNNVLVREPGVAGLLGVIELPPTGTQAMDGNKYPVTMIGLKTLLDKVIAQWEAEGKLGEVQTQKYPDAKLPSGEECVAYESMHPVPKKQFKFHITRLWIEKKTGLAIRIEQLGFPQKGQQAPPVIEEYTYSKIKTNVPLDNIDFDVNNPKYGFK